MRARESSTLFLQCFLCLLQSRQCAGVKDLLIHLTNEPLHLHTKHRATGSQFSCYQNLRAPGRGGGCRLSRRGLCSWCWSYPYLHPFWLEVEELARVLCGCLWLWMRAWNSRTPAVCSSQALSHRNPPLVSMATNHFQRVGVGEREGGGGCMDFNLIKDL